MEMWRKKQNKLEGSNEWLFYKENGNEREIVAKRLKITANVEQADRCACGPLTKHR